MAFVALGIPGQGATATTWWGSLKTKSDPERTECLRGRTPAWSGSLPYTTIDATRVRRIRDSASRPGARRGVWPSATAQPPAAIDALRACGMTSLCVSRYGNLSVNPVMTR